MSTTESLSRAIQQCGGQARLAERLGKRQQHVSMWLRRGRVPPNMAIPIELATGVPRHELRPDIYPPEEYQLIEQVKQQHAA